MEEKHSVKLNHLDLAKKRSELEEIFDSVINKIPDLCMPVSIRLSGENDFFNQTKGLQLVPFRKQRIFDTCISPELLKESEESDSNQAGSLREYISSSRGSQMQTRFGDIGKDYLVEHKNVKVSFKQSEQLIGRVDVPQEVARSQVARRSMKKGCSSASKQSTLELEKKRQIRAQLMENYSKLGLTRKKKKQKKDDRENAFDLLFACGPDDSYPFANPMPACMLTRENANNLRDIIFASHDIEWRMLTANRPTNPNEERYFDRLIKLHRDRLRCRQESGQLAFDQRLPFVHVRHSYQPKYAGIGIVRPIPNRHYSPLSMAVESKRKFRNRLKSNGNLVLLSSEMNIPTLILTSDEKSSAPIVDSASNSDHHEELEGFDYDNFSRFSRANRLQRKPALVLERDSSGTRRQQRTASFGSQLKTGGQLVDRTGRLDSAGSWTDESETSAVGEGDSIEGTSNHQLDEQVEEIMSNLIGRNLLAD